MRRTRNRDSVRHHERGSGLKHPTEPDELRDRLQGRWPPVLASGRAARRSLTRHSTQTIRVTGHLHPAAAAYVPRRSPDSNIKIFLIVGLQLPGMQA
jgi:hypothetical protein